MLDFKLKSDKQYGHKCATPCPYRKDEWVAGYGCTDCEFWIKSNMEKQWVLCNFEKESK